MENNIVFKMLDTLRDLIKDSQEMNRINSEAYAKMAKDIGTLREMVILKADSADVTDQLEKIYIRLNDLLTNSVRPDRCREHRESFVKFDDSNHKDFVDINKSISALRVSMGKLSTRVYITWAIGGTAITVAIGIVIKWLFK